MSLAGLAASSTIVPISAVGQIVDHEPPEILEHVGDPRATGPGQPGDQHDVGHAATLPIHPNPPER